MCLRVHVGMRACGRAGVPAAEHDDGGEENPWNAAPAQKRDALLCAREKCDDAGLA